jgi:hypothetical protein
MNNCIIKHQCAICNKILSSKQNLDNHIFNHRLDSIRINTEEQNNNDALKDNNNTLEDNNDTLEDNLMDALEDNLMDALKDNNDTLKDNNDTLKDNNDTLEDNLMYDNIGNNLMKDKNNFIQITIEEYNYFRTENSALKDELIKLNNKFHELNKENDKLKNENKRLNSTTINNNIDNSTTTNNVQITNNIQINIISFPEIGMIPPIYIDNKYIDLKSALYDFSKNFNRVNLDYSMERDGLNYNQKCKQEKLKKIVANNRKQKLPLLCLGICEVLGDYFSVPEHKNIRYITKYLFELLNGNKWEPITVYCAYRALFQLFIEGAKELYKVIKLKLSNKYKSIEFVIDDYQKNSEEYFHHGKGEFINMIKAMSMQ